ncbi:hypothetical protein Glove_117g549 [Diversispora epigaea]|uniref:Uncharacterized protein n=1 Tax=Diversispora epigaea TaxID=1348612 RepID=A0A397J090_9GLOM|nr:hypothetical protein Glove_117g549 [Diversispora epigaea]
MESRILEEKAQLQQNELKNNVHLERTRQILDATKDIRNQDHLLRETITKQIEKDLLNESHERIENLESVTVGQKRPYKEEVPSTPPNKIGSVIFDDEESTIPSFIPTITVDLSTPLIDTQDDDAFDNKVSREAYIKIRQDVRDRPSQKDWFIGECNVSNAFRNFQITNIDRLESGDTFFFSLNIEEILSLHHIMLVDLTRMKKPIICNYG